MHTFGESQGPGMMRSLYWATLSSLRVSRPGLRPGLPPAWAGGCLGACLLPAPPGRLLGASCAPPGWPPVPLFCLQPRRFAFSEKKFKATCPITMPWRPQWTSMPLQPSPTSSWRTEHFKLNSNFAVLTLMMKLLGPQLCLRPRESASSSSPNA